MIARAGSGFVTTAYGDAPPSHNDR